MREEPAARESVGYMARVLVQATLPHSAQEGCAYSRTNGRLRVSIQAPPELGLPYGVYPRLILAWIATEAVRTRSRRLELGRSLSQFMARLGVIPTGGQWGTIARLKDQLERLLASCISCVEESYDGEGVLRRRSNLLVAQESALWWSHDARRDAQGRSWVELSEPFYAQLIERPVPVDLRALAALKRSPLALDLYAWLTYRVSYLRRAVVVPWAALQAQLGADYATSAQGTRDLRRKILQALRKVQQVYPALRAQPTPEGLRIEPSASHVSARKPVTKPRGVVA